MQEGETSYDGKTKRPLIISRKYNKNNSNKTATSMDGQCAPQLCFPLHYVCMHAPQTPKFTIGGAISRPYRMTVIARRMSSLFVQIAYNGLQMHKYVIKVWKISSSRTIPMTSRTYEIILICQNASESRIRKLKKYQLLLMYLHRLVYIIRIIILQVTLFFTNSYRPIRLPDCFRFMRYLRFPVAVSITFLRHFQRRKSNQFWY